MDASLETLVTAAYVFACSLSIPRCGPRGKAADQQLIALAAAQAVTGPVSDRQFPGTIGRLLPGCFPQLPGQSQYNRRLRRLTPQITRVQLGLAELIAGGRVRLVDSTLLARANYGGKGCLTAGRRALAKDECFRGRPARFDLGAERCRQPPRRADQERLLPGLDEELLLVTEEESLQHPTDEVIGKRAARFANDDGLRTDAQL